MPVVEYETEVSVKEMEGVAIVEVGPDALVCGFPGCEHRLRDPVRLLLEGDKKKLLIDLSRVKRQDNSGIGQLVGAYAAAHEKGAKLRFVVDPASKMQEFVVYIEYFL